MIDLDHLDKYVAGDAALRDEILSIFAEQAGMHCRNLSASASDEDWRHIAHALKGASRGVGFWALGDLCEEAETMVGNIPGKTERRSAMMVSIRQKVAAGVSEVQRLADRAA